ncbi:hypothetical protein [Hymenobacter psychrophilus]|uniref:DUF4136 domain-containing protein n=1 Tax=Hymenobacter psychrophilus TaxID=651662 RepID=A0A1H3IZV2_9BACT|nr:hypothetical protein [Hymenobacter psychrophilus]SDY33236.1 hypothetical protein SAMN04488069_107225 [Hymenobacter psychrophilus]
MIRSLLYYLLALLLAGCASAHSLTQAGFQPTEAPAMPFTTPISAIGSIQRGNQVVFDSAATRASVGLLRRQLRAQQAGLRLSGELVIPDSLRLQAEQEIGRAVAALNSRPQLGGGANLPVLDYLLQQQGQRYVFVTAARGFTRSPGNYGGQVAKSIGVGLLTMGMLVPVSVKARSEIGVFVYDAQQRAIVYYCHTSPIEHEPLDETSVAKQLRTMLAKDYTFGP